MAVRAIAGAAYMAFSPACLVYQPLKEELSTKKELKANMIQAMQSGAQYVRLLSVE
jgi:hypothetical protein